MGKDSDLEQTLRPVVEVLERLLVPCYVGGSVASSSYGEPRTTLDIDLVTDLRAEHIGAFTGSLEENFVLNTEAVAESVRNRGCFNMIHKETIFKVDVLLSQGTEYAECALQRRRRENAFAGLPVYFATVEDTIFAKLSRYRQGGEVSQTQWHDIQGMLRMQKHRLDTTCLLKWTAKPGSANLLVRAYREAENLDEFDRGDADV